MGAAALDACEVAYSALACVADRSPDVLRQRYGLEALDAGPIELLEGVARSRGFLGRGGQLDVDRAADVLLRELRSGKLGRISFEQPGD